MRSFKLPRPSIPGLRGLRSYLKLLPIHLAVLVFPLSDWRLGAVTFGDLAIMAGVALLLPTLSHVSARQVLIVSTLAMIVICSLLSMIIFEGMGIDTESILYLAKVSMFSLFCVLLYNYVIKNELLQSTINVLIGWAVVISCIGLYITFVLSSGISLPYDFFWNFTRQDPESYMFRGYEDIVRTRSVFSEPQHLGLFLNLTLVLTLLNNQRLKINALGITVVSATAIATLSFATVPVTILIIVVAAFKRYGLRILTMMKTWGVLILIAIAMLLSWEYIDATIINRSQDISSGDDGSAMKRLVESWDYVDSDNILTGIGIGQLPPIWNNYAYVLSELGIVPFILMIGVTIIIIKRNPYLGIFFIVFSFQKGGYLSAYYWMMLAFLFIFSYRITDKFLRRG